MARLTVGQKAQRVSVFLVGLRHEAVTRALRRHGFRERDRLEGYRLLRALTDGVLGDDDAPPISHASLLTRLDEWENKWFPIIFASTRTRFPEAHAYLFRNLRQTQGPELIIGVGTLVSRIDALKTAVPRGAEARALLAERGLTEDVVEIARAALREIGEDPEVEPDPAISKEEFARREKAMWNWYREWGVIARNAVTDRRLLRSLGFLDKRGRPVDLGDEDDDVAEVAEDAAGEPSAEGAEGAPKAASKKREPA